MIKFEKISVEEYIEARMPREDIDGDSYNKLSEIYKKEWEGIKLPKRATSGSAGYDFFVPYDVEFHFPRNEECIGGFTRQCRQWETIPTGIRFVTDRDDIFVMCVPRSGLGIRHITKLANTVGIIDSDYFISPNEGHILIKMSADTCVKIDEGQAIMQGIIVPFLKTNDDNASQKRNGGFGSTNTQK